MTPAPDHPSQGGTMRPSGTTTQASGADRIIYELPASLSAEQVKYVRNVVLAYLSGVRDLHPGMHKLPQLPEMLGLAPGRMIVWLTPEQIQRADPKSTDAEAKRLGTLFVNSVAITDLGLVTNVTIKDGCLKVAYILTTDFCPAGTEFKTELGRAVVALFNYLNSQGMGLRDAKLTKGSDTWQPSFVAEHLQSLAVAGRSPIFDQGQARY